MSSASASLELSNPASDWTSHARRGCIIFVIATVLWRIIRYGMGFPVWGDEAGLMLNIVQRHSLRELLLPLENRQAAPIGFLVAQWQMVRLLGTSEYALRLFPLLTGLAGVVLFARLAWRALPPVAALVAVGLLASSHYITRYSLEIKPYGTDLTAASLLMLLGVEWMKSPWRMVWPILLIIAAPAMMLLSFPAVFVAGAVSAAMLIAFLRPRAGTRTWIMLGVYNVAILVTFALLLHFFLDNITARTRSTLVEYWSRGFPPGEIRGFLIWLLDVHTAEMMSYPLGGKNGGSTITCALCLVGIYFLVRSRQWPLLVMLGSTFALTFIAAVLRRYPYGGSARIAQHLAPAICLFVGSAGEGIIGWIRSPMSQLRTAWVISAALFVLLMGATIRDIVHPYQTAPDKQMQVEIGEWFRSHGSDSGMWLLDGVDRLPWEVKWYALRAAEWDRGRLSEGPIPNAAVIATRSEWLLVNCDPHRAMKSIELPGFQCVRIATIVPAPPKASQVGQVVEIAQWRRVR